MKRALVIGCPGAGKSTFARALRDCTGLPLYYLDQIWHRPDGSSITPQAFDERLAEILARECWIIDGNYLRTLEPRLERCDTVFLLDYPTEVCLAGAAARIGRPREDLPWTEQAFDPEFRQWIVDFPGTQLPQILRLLERHQSERQTHIFRSREQAGAWLGQFGGLGHSSKDRARRGEG